MKRRLISALCAGLLLISGVLELFGAASASRLTVYFMVVNETVLDLRSDTMPFTTGGEVYVPYTMFDPNTTGIGLGVYATYSNNIAMVYSRADGAVMFDLTTDSATSSMGAVFTKKAIRRNSVVFVPVDLVCKYFGLDWKLIVDRDYGFIIRVRSSSSKMSDEEFIPAAKNTLITRYSAYVRSVTGIEEPPAPEEPTTTPTPPEPVVTPTPPPTQSPAPEGGDVYLGFRCDQGGDTAALAADLARYGAWGLFFFRPSELAQRDGEVRALAAAGHRIGLLLDGESEEEREEQALLGNQLLGHILRFGADIALTGAGEAAPEGWFAWNTTADGLPGERTENRQVRETVREAETQERAFLLMDDSSQSVETLERILRDLKGAGCDFRLAVETVLGE